jgi:hypothetical protein
MKKFLMFLIGGRKPLRSSHDSQFLNHLRYHNGK